MQRIAKMRLHLCKLAKTRLPHAGGVAAETGKYLPSMPPPKRIQEALIRQAIASGLLDNIARRAPPGVLPQEFTGIPRSAYICGNSKLKEPLFIDNNSTVHSKRPEWVCFDSIVRKTKKDGTTVATMQKVTPIDPEWIATLCHGSNLMTLGSPLATPLPRYMKEKDSIQCAVETKFGGHGWEIPPCYLDMYETIQEETNDDKKRQTSAVMEDDSFRWFARYLLEGTVLSELDDLLPMLNDEPAIITRRKPAKKVLLIVSSLSSAGIDSAAALRKHWAEKDTKFLFKALKPWVKKDCVDEFKRLWISCVNSNVDEWKNRRSK
jgi:ATP-dependent RNA helicase DHX37/DHR1